MRKAMATRALQFALLAAAGCASQGPTRPYIQAGQAGWADVLVVDEGGKPVPGAHVHCSTITATSQSLVDDQSTGDDGHASCAIPGQRVSLVASASTGGKSGLSSVDGDLAQPSLTVRISAAPPAPQAPPITSGPAATPAPQQRDTKGCWKMVFDKICLGGQVGDSMKTVGATLADTHGNYKRWTMTIDGNLTGVGEIDGKVASVMQIRRPPTFLTYTSVRTLLDEKYGPGRETKVIPDYAKAQSSIDTAVMIGKAQYLDIWEQGSWAPWLVWDSKGVVLHYEDHTLATAATAAANSGL